MNKIFLIGNLGKDPEVRQINETTLATFTMATTEKWKNGERTDWHTVKVWGGLAGVVEKYLRKGDKVMIAGRIQHDEVEKDGQKRWYTSVVATDMEMLGSASGPKEGNKAERSAGLYDTAQEPEPAQSDEDDDQLPF